MVMTSNEIRTNAESDWNTNFEISDDPNVNPRKEVNTTTPILRFRRRQTDTRQSSLATIHKCTNPALTDLTADERQVRKLFKGYKTSFRGRRNSLSNRATDEEICEPNAIAAILLRLDAENNSCLFKQNKKVARSLGEVHLGYPNNRVLLRTNGRFGSDGGYLQDVWSSLALLSEEDVLPPHLQAIANAMLFADRDRRNIRQDD